MKQIIKSAEDFKEPFNCFCAFMRFCQEAGEDYIDYNETIVKAHPFTMWLLGKGYISNAYIEKFCETDRLSIQDVLKDEVLFPNTYGQETISNAKAYSFLAEYMSTVKEFRNRLYDSTGDKTTSFQGGFYKNNDGISLAYMVNEDDLIKNTYVTNDEFIRKVKCFDYSLRDLFDFVTSITIEEADELSVIEQ